MTKDRDQLREEFIKESKDWSLGQFLLGCIEFALTLPHNIKHIRDVEENNTIERKL